MERFSGQYWKKFILSCNLGKLVNKNFLQVGKKFSKCKFYTKNKKLYENALNSSITFEKNPDLEPCKVKNKTALLFSREKTSK